MLYAVLQFFQYWHLIDEHLYPIGKEFSDLFLICIYFNSNTHLFIKVLLKCLSF